MGNIIWLVSIVPNSLGENRVKLYWLFLFCSSYNFLFIVTYFHNGQLVLNKSYCVSVCVCVFWKAVTGIYGVGKKSEFCLA